MLFSGQMYQVADFLNDSVRLSCSIWNPLNPKSIELWSVDLKVEYTT